MARFSFEKVAIRVLACVAETEKPLRIELQERKELPNFRPDQREA